MSSPPDPNPLWRRSTGSGHSRDHNHLPHTGAAFSRSLLHRASRNPFDDDYANPEENEGSSVYHASEIGTSEDHQTHPHRQQSSYNPFRDSTQDPFTPVAEPKSFIDVATKSSDFEALQEGLNFALGSQANGANWFPVDKNKSNEELARQASHSSIDPDVTPGYQDDDVYTETIPLENLPSNSPLRKHPSMSSPTANSHTPFPFNGPAQNNIPQRPALKVVPPLTLDLELGHLLPHSPHPPVGTPGSKFADVLVRVSDRIAGSGSMPKSPTLETPRPTLSRSNSDLATQDAGSSHIASRPSSGYFPSGNNGVPNLTITDENDVTNMAENDSNLGGLGLYMSNETLPGRESQSPIRKHTIPNASSTSLPFKPNEYSPPNTLYLFGKSFYIFPETSPIRQFAYRVSCHQFTNLFLLTLLLFQVLLLTYRQWNPPALKGYYYSGYNWADYTLIGVNIIYTIEIFLKCIAFGLIDDSQMFDKLGISRPVEKDLLLQPFFVIKFLEFVGLKSRKRKQSNYNVTNKYPDSAYDSNNISSDEGDNGKEFSTRNEEIKDTENLIQTKYSGMHEGPSNGSLHTSKPTLAHTNTLMFSKGEVDIDALKLKRAYLRNNWQQVDFISMVAFWISLIISIDQYDSKHHIMLFRAVSCLRIVRLCNLTTGTTTILTACRAALPKLIDVSIFIACFWLLFGIIGVQSFKSSLTRHCVWTNPLDPTETYVNSEQYCGSYIDLDGKAKPYLRRDGTESSYVKGFRCPKFSQCISGENPYNGTVNFDNVLQSMELVFVVMSANTFTDIMYYTMDSDNLGACLFFIFCIFIMTVWLINIFVAVIVTSFNVTRMEQAESNKPKTSTTWLLRFFNRGSTNYASKLDELKRLKKLLRLYYRFEFLFVIIVVVAMFTQCFREYDMADDTRHLLYRFECVYTLILLVEILVRFGLHFPEWRLFFASNRNCFDLFLAVFTSIIILGPVKRSLGQGYYWLTVFQLMRFYRVVLATSLTRNLWMKIMGNFRALFDLTLFFFVLTFVVSIIVARYYEGAIPLESLTDVDFPLHTLPNTFVGLYTITSTENWTDILYSLQEYATTTSYRSFGAILLIGWFIISNMIILNIFIAIIAKTLEVSEEEKRKQQLRHFMDSMTARLQTMDTEVDFLSRVKKRLFKKNPVRDELEKAVVNLLLSGTAVNDFLETQDENEEEDPFERDNGLVSTLSSSKWKRWIQVRFSRILNLTKNPFFTKQTQSHNLTDFDPATFAKNILSDRNALISKQNKFLQENRNFNRVFYVLEPRHRIRRFCQRLVKSSHGERIDGVEPNKKVSEAIVFFMFLVTLALVISACYLTPLYRKGVDQKHGKYNWTFYLDNGFLAIFTIEFLIKIIADGLVFTPNAYIMSSWNIIDLWVLLALWIEFIAFMQNDGNLSRFIRGFKALRALRLLTISEVAKNNFQHTMITGFWKIINAALISLCLLFPFSIWGLNVFNGRLGYCIDGSSDLASCFNEYLNVVFNWEVYSPNVYTNPQLEFNRWPTAFATFFEIVSLEGWVDLLLNVMQSTGVGTPQEHFASPFNGFMIILFNFVSMIFILTLFVSVIISNYSRTTGRAYMTRDQISWYQIKKFLVQVKPSQRKQLAEMSVVRRFCYKMTVEKNKHWNRFIICVLIAQVAALLMECFPSGRGLDTLRITIYIIASTCLLLQSIMKAIGQGWHTFISHKWNNFSLVVSLGAFVTSLIGLFVTSESAFLNINKLFLVATLTFVIPRSDRLSQLLRFASASLPLLLSLSFTWIVVFLVFAIALNQIFGLTRIGPNGTGNLNLRSVPKALILLFRCSFGEGWNYIMEDYTVEEPFCQSADSLDNSDCGNKQYAYILFIAWNLISMYIFLNMFVSLILDSFSYINSTTAYSHLIDREEVRKFKRTWQKFDPEGTGYIRPYCLPKFLHSLEGSIAFHFYSGSLSIPELCKAWITKNDVDNPYDITINYAAMEETMLSMDVAKIRERRKLYEMFIEEAMLTMELNQDPGISFTRILLQLPLYTYFEAGKCLDLIDFLERRLLLQKVQKRIHTTRVYETIAAYACRWKYAKDKRLGIRDTNIDFTQNLRRASYLSNEDAGSRTSMIDEVTELPVRDPFVPEENSPLLGNKKAYVPNSPLHTYNRGPRSGTSFANLPRFEIHGSDYDARLPYADTEKEKQGSDLSLIDMTHDDK